MKILLLDVDGVLCTRRSFLAYDKEGGMWFSWDQLACDVIRTCASYGVMIVVSSTWRKPKNEPELISQLHRYGFTRSMLFMPDWKTPILPSGVRGEEIQAWLDAHPDIKDYKILDDDCILLDDQEKHWIQTDPDGGMTSDNIKKLLNWAGALKS
jgi:hypothetical protein